MTTIPRKVLVRIHSVDVIQGQIKNIICELRDYSDG